ncbi:hypothetical protein Angca_006974 [Angiostrongylus cantonensis]|nr:hypothetical protein Angca_006974 [Angiostrongylus cantonensis]
MKNEAAINSEQEKLLESATRVIRSESLEMKRCLDKGETMDALKHASQFLSELRTSELSPKYYYRLYMDAVSELQHLESFLVDEHERNKSNIEKLYECVQYAGAIIPRLYLLITIGVVYIKCGEDTRRNILSDLVEMCRGVQNPLRGLFLRNYLLQSTRTLLPDSPDLNTTDVNDLPESDKEPQECDGTVSDAVHFVLVNFAEMNKLWVRMQHQGPSREREKREKDRMELRLCSYSILVGTNLVRLSQLENLTEEMYVKEVLPSILEQVVSCRDRISQEYLMECVIQVFGDDFHLATLNEFLQACGDLVPEVNVKNILIALIERLAIFSANPEARGIPTEIHLFDIFSEQAKNLVKNHTDMSTEDIVSLYAAIVNLAIKCYRNRPEFANTTFGSLKCILEERKKTAVEPFDAVGRELMKLIRLPIDAHNNALKVAELTEFVPVMECFKYQGRCIASSYIIQEIEDFEDEQHLVARLVHLIQADTPDEQFLVNFMFSEVILLTLMKLRYLQNSGPQVSMHVECAHGPPSLPSLRASQCLEPIVQQQLFIKIIDTLLYYYEDNCLEITEDMLVELLSRSKDNAVQLDVSAEADALEKHFAMTLQHIKRFKDKRPELAERLQL